MRQFRVVKPDVSQGHSQSLLDEQNQLPRIHTPNQITARHRDMWSSSDRERKPLSAREEGGRGSRNVPDM